MRMFRYVVLAVLLCSSVAAAQVGVGIGIRRENVSIGINLSTYPQLVAIPGYPVYYAPRLPMNFFFYDGMYWVFVDDNWYESTWYNGPWWLVEPDFVPVFILRIPVRYYRHPPAFFRGWRPNAPPHWGEHWGRNWEERRRGWDKWNRSAAPAPAPLPSYQRRYTGERYPRQVQEQHQLQERNYRYQPRDATVQRQYREQAAPRPPREMRMQPQQPRMNQGRGDHGERKGGRDDFGDGRHPDSR